MAMNTGKLAGRTAFITGASRGIGKAIALKLARDGANIIIAAKTAEPHPKLPGTIYTAAKEIEDAGGKCLPCIVDIREEETVLKAVEEGVKIYGGIDILINNASAISLTGTLQTPMKRYDLMNTINARGTYLCSQACIPYLKKGHNPHILNISPPLNLKPIWFKSHVAYTMAKYGMSMCVLGMSEEFKSDGIAVNALWPKTAIATAAMEMLGGKEALAQCRKPEIMADAAYAILTRDSRSKTGEFLIDENVLQDVGVTNFDSYAHDPEAELLPDFFLDEFEEKKDYMRQLNVSKAKSDAGQPVDQVSVVFQKIQGLITDELVQSVNGVFQFKLSGDGDTEWYLDLKNGAGSTGQGQAPDGANVTMELKAEDFTKCSKENLIQHKHLWVGN